MELTLPTQSYSNQPVISTDSYNLPLSPEQSDNLEKKYLQSLSRIGEYSQRFIQLGNLFECDEIPTLSRVNSEVHEINIRFECEIVNRLWRMRELNKLMSEQDHPNNCNYSNKIIEDVMDLMASKTTEVTISGEFDLGQVKTQLYDIGLLNSDEVNGLDLYYSNDLSSGNNSASVLPHWLSEPIYQGYYHEISQELTEYSNLKTQHLLRGKIRMLSACCLIQLVSNH
jgi:hypothetical protein